MVAWERWLNFNKELGSPALPPSESSILAFLCSLIQLDFSFNHINKILAGVSFFLKLNNFPACNSFFSVKQALKGLRKVKLAPDKRRPITLDTLSKLCLATPFVCISEYEAILFHAAFVLMFFAAFRISEMLPNNKHSLEGLFLSEVSFSDDKVFVFVRKSKMDRSGKGQWLNLFAFGDSILCPLLILKKYLSARPASGQHFFCSHRFISYDKIPVFISLKTLFFSFGPIPFQIFYSFFQNWSRYRSC